MQTTPTLKWECSQGPTELYRENKINPGIKKRRDKEACVAKKDKPEQVGLDRSARKIDTAKYARIFSEQQRP